ncbi:MAG: tetratricopeptide repeat protein [Planctomycetes bacterium]|nr:tetratricopeptide repeat protein [Planctomycetota bacterium]
MADAAAQLQQGMEFHRAGKLGEAEKSYAAIAEDSPQFVDAIHLRGVLALQRGNPSQSIQMITRAVQMRPDVPAMHSNLAEAYRVVGRNADAIAHCRAALKLDPNYHACRNNLALALAANGEVAEAEKELRYTVDKDPRNALAWNNLGNILRTARRNEDALVAARKAVQLEPANPEFLSNLGQMLLEDGDVDEALMRLQNAVKLAPNLAAARNNYGNALRETGELEAAQAQYDEALKLSPQLAITHNNIGQLEQQKGEYQSAISWYERSLKLDPRSTKTICNLASAFADMERRQDAAVWFRRALEIDADCVEAMIGLAANMRRGGDAHTIEESERLFRRALELNPRLPAAHMGLAQICSERGDFKGTEAACRAALRIDPLVGGAYEQLANSLRKNLPASDAEAMEKALQAGPRLREPARISILYGLGAYNDSVGEHEWAARYLDEANELTSQNRVKRNAPYDPDEHTSWINRLAEVFTPEHFQRVKDWGNDSDVPVFVLGLPRSGTTLSEQVLASHPQIFGADELRLARDSFLALPSAVGITCEAPDAVPMATQKAVADIAADHLDKLRAYDREATRIVDKMPENYVNIGWILTMFPNAKIIHLQRDLRDVATSCWQVHFGSIRWAERKEHIVSHFRNYMRIMAHWDKVLPGRILHVPYAGMVDDLEAQARRMLDWVGMDWDPKCLEFHKTERNVRTASLAQVRQPLYKKAVERWRNYEPWWGDWYAELDALQQ